ncbi:MAG: MBL fold metallo-hydrolase [Treponema sp.]|jgi:phosphoribosyl 1,2-cyclic phosphodiesterase|nr:MBL fold metallo-hydrolase [Treponema sp.]
MLSVRIWGCRGSIPCPGPSTVTFGGNTACLEIRADRRLVIIDMGTGIRLLGDWLLEHDVKTAPLDTDIFVTHTHWDHIMGFPLFAPLFNPTTKLRIHGPVSCENDTLESIIGTQLSYRYWPVRLSDLAARIKYDQLQETTLDLGDGLRVSAKYLNHPVLCLGYRFAYQGKSIVTVYDTEPFRNLFPVDPADPHYDEDAAREGSRAAQEENEKISRFMQNADVLIHDSQYTAAEYEAERIGWGHSSYEYAVAAAQKTGVKKLVLFHHDPRRSDRQLAALETRFRETASAGPGPEIIMAREGLTIEA